MSGALCEGKTVKNTFRTGSIFSPEYF